MIDISIWIREYIMAERVSFREFAKMCDMPNSTLQSICERGIASASFANATKIAGVLGVDISTFAFGNSDISISKEEREILEGYRKLDNRGKSLLQAVVESELSFLEKSCSAEEKKPLKFGDYIKIEKRKQELRTIKIFLQPAAAGLGSYVDDDYFEEVQMANVPQQADFGVRISGDSMQPKIQDGEVVFVKKQEEIAEGEIGIYIIDGDAFCKKLLIKNGTPYLHSLNPKYQDFQLPENAYVVGKVILQ